MPASSGSGGPGVQCRALASATLALIACSSRSAMTPRKLPSRTTATTPGIAFTAASSMVSSLAPYCGGRTTRPCTMPGSRRSCT